MTAMEDEETQRRGIVCIFYPGGNNEYDMLENNRILYEALYGSYALPVYIAGVHFCFEHTNALPVASMIMNGAGRHTRTRFRFHQGTSAWLVGLLVQRVCVRCPRSVAYVCCVFGLSLVHHDHDPPPPIRYS